MLILKGTSFLEQTWFLNQGERVSFTVTESTLKVLARWNSLIYGIFSHNLDLYVTVSVNKKKNNVSGTGSELESSFFACPLWPYFWRQDGVGVRVRACLRKVVFYWFLLSFLIQKLDKVLELSDSKCIAPSSIFYRNIFHVVDLGSVYGRSWSCSKIDRVLAFLVLPLELIDKPRHREKETFMNNVRRSFCTVREKKINCFKLIIVTAHTEKCINAVKFLFSIIKIRTLQMLRRIIDVLPCTTFVLLIRTQYSIMVALWWYT